RGRALCGRVSFTLEVAVHVLGILVVTKAHEFGVAKQPARRPLHERDLDNHPRLDQMSASISSAVTPSPQCPALAVGRSANRKTAVQSEPSRRRMVALACGVSPARTLPAKCSSAPS